MKKVAIKETNNPDQHILESYQIQGKVNSQQQQSLSTVNPGINSIVLAAAQGDRFGEHTKEIPKTLLKIKGKSILSMQMEAFNDAGIKDMTIVRGFGKEKIDSNLFKTVDNDIHHQTKELYSLFLAKEHIRENTVISYGDIVFKKYILDELLEDENDITIVVDADYEIKDENQDYVTTVEPYSHKLFLSSTNLIEMSSALPESRINGEFIGLWKVNKAGGKIVKEALEKLSQRADFKSLTLCDLFNEIAKTKPISIRFIKGFWLDIDSIVDLIEAEVNLPLQTETGKINTRLLGDALAELGFDFYSGVPCSFLKYLINYSINHCEYIPAANEGDAVSICAGAHLAGRKPVVLFQNSGLTNATSPLISLNHPFKLPVLGFVSLRGEEGIKDQPQHKLMGLITTSMLELMEIKWEYLSTNNAEMLEQLKRANACIENNQSFFFVVKKDTFEEEKLQPQTMIQRFNKQTVSKSDEDTYPKRIEVLETLNTVKDENTLLLATTGKTGREMYEVEDASNNLYMVGSMGCISSMALGLALNKIEKDVIAIDGDGALLMRMGSLATNAYCSPSNMLHILLDNNVHDSTGAQVTVSQNIDFVKIAASVGYENAIYVHNLDELQNHIQSWKKQKGLTFLYLKTAKGSKSNLRRPDVKPHEVKERLMQFINTKFDTNSNLEPVAIDYDKIISA